MEKYKMFLLTSEKVQKLTENMDLSSLEDDSWCFYTGRIYLMASLFYQMFIWPSLSAEQLLREILDESVIL